MNLTLPSFCITNPVPRYNSSMSPDAQRILDEARQLPPVSASGLPMAY